MNDAAYLFLNEDNPRFKDHLFTLTSLLPQDFRTFVEITNERNYRNHRETEKGSSRIYSCVSGHFPHERARGNCKLFSSRSPDNPPGYITGDPPKFPVGETSVPYSRIDGVSHVDGLTKYPALW